MSVNKNVCVRATISEWTPELMKSKVMAVLTAGRRGGGGGREGERKEKSRCLSASLTVVVDVLLCGGDRIYVSAASFIFSVCSSPSLFR